MFLVQGCDYQRDVLISYVDLVALYGEMPSKIRVHGDQGLLQPDIFAEDRLPLLPPAVCTLLVLFNCNHIRSRFYDVPP